MKNAVFLMSTKGWTDNWVKRCNRLIDENRDEETRIPVFQVLVGYTSAAFSLKQTMADYNSPYEYAIAADDLTKAKYL